MTNSKVVPRGQRSDKLWVPSLLLLLGQFLTITPALMIVFSDEQQRRASDEYVNLLDGLDRLSLTVAELQNIPPQNVLAKSGETTVRQERYSDCRAELKRILAGPEPTPQMRERLTRIDATVQRMAANESALAGLAKKPQDAEFLAAASHKDGQAVRSELLDAQRFVRLELSTAGNNINQKTTYLKALVGGACLLAFGVVFLIRKFRIDAAIQRALQKELQKVNEEVIAALAAARSESEARNNFLAHVGHLLQTPLSAIVGGTGELLGSNLAAEQRACAKNSLESAESLSKLAAAVTDYSRMESGSLNLQLVEFEPANVVTDVLNLFRLPAERKGLRLKSAIGSDLPGLVKGDPERLRQVLVNLMSNSVHFTQKGEILLRAEEVMGAEGRTTLRFEVKDTGTGISEQARHRIFEPFNVFPASQAGAATKQDNAGAGLGLAISKKLVELMGGKLDVDSELGRGCTFYFTAVFERVRTGSKPQPKSDEIAAPPTNPPVSSKTRNEKTKVRERRAEPRHGISYPTLLRSEQAGIAIIRVLDVSTSGLRVSVPFRLDVLGQVEIRIEGTSVIGIVRNCTCIRANEFHVGIELSTATAGIEGVLHHLRLLHPERVGR